MVAISPSMRSHSWSEVNSVVMENPLAFADSAFVSVGNEGHRRYLERQALPAQFGKYPAADCCMRRCQIAHRDRRIEARAKTTRSDRADLFSGCGVRE